MDKICDTCNEKIIIKLDPHIIRSLGNGDRYTCYRCYCKEKIIDSTANAESLREQIKELDAKIEDLEDQVDKLNKINETLRTLKILKTDSCGRHASTRS
jgi:hypothetical protein